MKTLLINGAVIVSLASLAHVSHRALDAAPPPQSTDPRQAYPAVSALKIMSLSYDSLVADYYWLQAIYHFGDKRMHRHNYPNLLALVQRVVALDPYFAGGYLFAGTALTLKGMDPRPAIAILEQGVQYRPEIWQIPFLLGFNRYYFLGDYAGAARALAQAAALPDAPPYIGALATRVASEGGEPELGLTLVDELLEGVEDEQLRHEYEERRQHLLLTYHLKHLNAAVARYREQQGAIPSSLQALVEAQLLPSIPEEPYGGRYELAASGEVRSSSGVEPLGIAEQFKNPELAPQTGGSTP